MIEIRDRNHARDLIAEAGITTDNVTDIQLESLRLILSSELKNSSCMGGSMRVFNRKFSKFLRCNSHYFKGREAISFNRDGFIGMAGWSDGTNVKPILSAISVWLESEK